MLTVHKNDNVKIIENGEVKSTVELRGLSTDTKPTKIGNKVIDNGSVFIEIDTGKIFFYDLENEQWKEA